MHMHVYAQFTKKQKFSNKINVSTFFKTHYYGLQIMLPLISSFTMYLTIVYMSFKTCEFFGVAGGKI